MPKAVQTILNYILPSLAVRGRGWVCLIFLASCDPEPPLYLYDAQEVTTDLPMIDLELDLYWDYDLDFNLNYGADYNWKKRWYYGWDSEDRRLWGEIGYTEPTTFDIRRYYTGDVPLAPHTGVIADVIEGTHYEGRYDWGFWDILVWNDIKTPDGIQSLIFDEQTSLDSVTAYTNASMNPSRYHAPRYTRAFYQPEELFAAYEQAIEINRKLDGFTFIPERNVWVRTLNMLLKPITYIYLTQVILHHNQNRITAIEGSSNLSGMARTTNVNLGRAGNDVISVYYYSRMKRDLPLVPYGTPAGDPSILSAERVDIIGGRLLTFGICNLCANTLKSAREVVDANRHYMDITLQFYNGLDSTLVFDVTDQVRRQYKGGVITVELDLDTVPIPSRKGGSGFNAVVQDYEDGGTHEFGL